MATLPGIQIGYNLTSLIPLSLTVTPWGWIPDFVVILDLAPVIPNIEHKWVGNIQNKSSGLHQCVHSFYYDQNKNTNTLFY